MEGGENSKQGYNPEALPFLHALPLIKFLFFQMRPSVITCASSLRNPSSRSEGHRSDSSGQPRTFLEWAHFPDVPSLVITHASYSSVSNPTLLLTHLGVYVKFCQSSFVLQWFPKAIMIMSLRSISRGAWVLTTRKPSPSSSPSACLSTTTSPRLWETSGYRLNASLPPVPPHPPAVQVSLTPPPTATAQICATKSPPAARCYRPATGLSIKAEITSDPGGNWTCCDF